MTAEATRLNPYIAGRALDEDKAFFGREEVFRMVATEFASPNRNAVVLFGQRRIGKTSILKQLSRRLPHPPFVTVYFDLMNRAYKPLGYVLWEIAVSIADCLEIEGPAPDSFDDHGRRFKTEFLPTVYEALSSDRRLVLLFDEFDVLDVAAQNDLPHSVASKSFFPYLTELMGSEPRLGFVFVVGRQAEDLTIDAKGVFKAARYRRVSVLESNESLQLIRIAERQGTLRFADGLPEALLELTGGHPFFIQLVCQMLWDQTRTESESSVAATDAPEVTVASLAGIIPRVLEAGASNFEWIWDGLPPGEKVVFSAIAELAGDRPKVFQAEIEEALRRNGIRILVSELELAPETLVKWEMLRRVDGAFCFCVDLMRRWVAQRKPLAAVKDELDRLNPVADTLFQSGKFFYDRRMLDKSENQLREALAINLNHIKARVLLAQILQEQGKAREAVQELELLYRYDERAATPALVRALVGLGETLERETDKSDLSAELLSTYERVLALSPTDSQARTRRAELIEARGTAAMNAGDYAIAIKHFDDAGAADRLREARAKAFEAADVAFRHGKLDDALTNYRLAAAEERVSELEGRIAAKERIWQRYTEAKNFVREERFEEAKRALADVVYLQPDFETAAVELAALVAATDGQASAQAVGTAVKQERLGKESVLRQALTSWLRCLLVAPLAFLMTYATSTRFAANTLAATILLMVFTVGLAAVVEIGIWWAAIEMADGRSVRPSRGKGLLRTLVLIGCGYPLVVFLLLFQFGQEIVQYSYNFGLAMSILGRNLLSSYPSAVPYSVAFLMLLLPVFVVLMTVATRLKRR